MQFDFDQVCRDNAMEIEHFLDWLNHNKTTPDAQALMLMMMELCLLMEEFKPDFTSFAEREMLVDFYYFAADQAGGVWGDAFERFFTIDQLMQRNSEIDMLEACYKKSKDLTR